ncbi:tyrosine-type recombinase/integrase [Leisingera sp. ANG-Vp]|uniref:tyrosine-type recombinase/integrase n=1 Tax=Leisingera sp. ANG-Vp TaxID=1577896 RepID=UPI00057E4A76|nr:tyrosine-type recombinase/integrase [Leisingera sp. ANG-Vp]KIC22480.1 hypothetical protein RA20_00950 [Leisingera sp. ANG-Vp]
MKKPAKPRIRKPNLAWKWSKGQGAWEPYHRVTWTEGGKRKEKAIKLDWKGNAERLDALYWECRSGNHDQQKEPAKYTWRKLIVAWRKDPRIQGDLAESTKRTYRRDMDRILEKNADKDVRRTTRQAVRAAHDKLADTPRKADKYLQTIRLLWNYGQKELDWPLSENPASGIRMFGRQREYEPWPEWLINKLKDAPQSVRTAAELILGTGQRPNAAIKMRRDQFRAEWMEVLDEKAGESFETYCPEDLRRYIDALPNTGRHVLAKNLSQPLGYDSVEKAFRTWRNGLGDKAKPFVLHGLRKLAIVRLAEAGCSDAEIQAVTGQSAEMVAYYRKRASRKALSRAAQKRRS